LNASRRQPRCDPLAGVPAAIDKAWRTAPSRADRLAVRLIGPAIPPPLALVAKIDAAIEPFAGDVIATMMEIGALLCRSTA
jgi:hypothetical protein